MPSPCLWFNTQAEEAANFYTTIFEKGAILSKTNYVRGASTSRNIINDH